MPSITLATQTVATQTGTAVPTIPTTVLTNSLTALDTTASQGPASNADNTALPLYGCRAFVNFNGINASTTNVVVNGVTEAHCVIRSSGNVSKVVRNTTGTYTIHFVTPMPDTNYVVLGSSIGNTTNYFSAPHGQQNNVIGTTSVKVVCPAVMGSTTDGIQDIDTVQIVIFR